MTAASIYPLLAQGERGQHRGGQHGTLESNAGNGFWVFHSDTGARFTIRAEEFTPDCAAPEQRAAIAGRVKGWPRHNFTMRHDRAAGSLAVHTLPARSVIEPARVHVGANLKRDNARGTRRKAAE